MYLPQKFEIKDQQKIKNFLSRHSFATIVTETSAGPFASHLPLIISDEDLEQVRILGHMARENPQWKHFSGNKPILVIFNGPHAYISPSWYESSPQVPTWNYAVAHVYGRARVLDDHEAKKKILFKMVEQYEESRKNPWKYDLPEDFDRRLIMGIVGFEISVDRIEAKFKISQNRKAGDRDAVMKHLSSSQTDDDQKLSELMKEFYADVARNLESD